MMIYIVHQQDTKPSATKRAIIPTTFKLFYSYIKKSNTKLGLPSMTRKRNSLEKELRSIGHDGLIHHSISQSINRNKTPKSQDIEVF